MVWSSILRDVFPESLVCINTAWFSKPSGLEFGKARDVEWSLRLGVGEKYPEAVWALEGAVIGHLDFEKVQAGFGAILRASFK